MTGAQICLVGSSRVQTLRLAFGTSSQVQNAKRGFMVCNALLGCTAVLALVLLPMGMFSAWGAGWVGY